LISTQGYILRDKNTGKIEQGDEGERGGRRRRRQQEEEDRDVRVSHREKKRERHN